MLHEEQYNCDASTAALVFFGLGAAKETRKILLSVSGNIFTVVAGNNFPRKQFSFTLRHCNSKQPVISSKLLRRYSQFMTGTIGYEGVDWRDEYDVILIWPWRTYVQNQHY